MKAWEVWTWEGHPCLLISNQVRIDRKAKVVVLKGQTLYAGDPAPTPLETVLDTEDGLDRRTVFVCDLLFTALKSELSQKRGEVGWQRRRDISIKIVQGLALAGL
ncbi:putative Transcriptional modulator of MazE/toxin, MazF [Verrucomicrobia bacterium]|nr:putative Transcriptional modulator of MazE/toxin, MazF [Verrucomicrobiota bacterium]